VRGGTRNALQIMPCFRPVLGAARGCHADWLEPREAVIGVCALGRALAIGQARCRCGRLSHVHTLGCRRWAAQSGRAR